jgi:hypothetical protein
MFSFRSEPTRTNKADRACWKSWSTSSLILPVIPPHPASWTRNIVTASLYSERTSTTASLSSSTPYHIWRDVLRQTWRLYGRFQAQSPGQRIFPSRSRWWVAAGSISATQSQICGTDSTCFRRVQTCDDHAPEVLEGESE